MGLDFLFESKRKETWKDIKEEILTKCTTFYEHALKYKHNPAKQSTYWIGTIRRTSNESREALNKANNPLTIIEKISPEEYKAIYEIGMKRAKNDGNYQCNNKYDVLEEFPDIIKITDSTAVENFLRTNAKHPYVKDYLFKEYVDWNKYLNSLTETDRETLKNLSNYKDLILCEEVANFLKPNAPKEFKEAALEYKKYILESQKGE